MSILYIVESEGMISGNKIFSRRFILENYDKMFNVWHSRLYNLSHLLAQNENAADWFEIKAYEAKIQPCGIVIFAPANGYIRHFDSRNNTTSCIEPSQNNITAPKT